MLAIFILLLGLLGVIQSLILGSQISSLNKMATVASSLVQEKMEDEISKPYQSLSVGTTTEDFGTISGFPSHKRITRTICVLPSDLSETACNYDLANDPEPSKKVEVSVFWRSPFNTLLKEIEATILISKK